MKKQVIEYAGIPVGIIVPENDRLRFIAVKYHVYPLNDRYFSSVSELHAAIQDLMAYDGDQIAVAA